MRIAVIGANGQLGTDVRLEFERAGHYVCPLTHAEIEIDKIDSVNNVLRGLRPDVVVNTAAMHHVEHCERDADRAFAVNGIGARNLAIASADMGFVLIHISTDYVFDGRKSSPYSETDTPCPLNVYGASKLAGEYLVRQATRRHFVLRTSGLYGNSACRAKGGLNFVKLMLKLAKEKDEIRVTDAEVVTPTSTAELARQIRALSTTDCYGLYHATAEGQCSWFEFARTVFEFSEIKTRLSVARPDEFPMKVPRPSYSVLENAGLKSAGLNRFTSWQNGLREYLGLTPLIEQATASIA